MEKSIFKYIINPGWIEIFDEIDHNIIKITEEDYVKIKDKPNIFPSYNKIFNFTKYCNLEDAKVLIIGQDPFHGLFFNPDDKSYYPQAMGLAFSVPNGCPIPPSLINIYKNMSRFNHQVFVPTNGNLEYLAYQGVLLMNTSFTVEKSKPNSHQHIWSMFADELIEVMTRKHPGLIIVLWGGNALSKMNIIKNKDKHDFIISSHPSPLGYKNKIKCYDSFYETNHFEKINQILRTKNKQEIDWQIY